MSPTVLGSPVEVPAGVSPALMQELAAALEAQLLAQDGKGLSDVIGVYVDPLSRNDQGADTVIGWAYNNTGDYDQNGEVNIADLTQIGVNFGKTVADGDWIAASVADGDGNGEINIADITPIGANFGSVVSNYVIEADVDGTGDWRPVANCAFIEGQVLAGSPILQFSKTINNGTAAHGFRVYAAPPVPAGDLYQLQIDPNAFQATLYAIPMSGYAALDVDFEVVFTNFVGDIDVTIDYDDGSPTESDNSPGGGILLFQHTYTNPGVYTATITATDNDKGQSDNDDEPVTVNEFTGSPLFNPSNWTTDNVEDGPDFGQFNAVALVGGMPVIAYVDVDDEEVMYARATVAKPSVASDWVTTSVEDGTDMITFIDIVECQGVPCLVWENQSDTDIYFAYATSAAPTGPADWVIHKPDNDGIKDPTIENLGDNPILLYHSFGGLRFARSTVVGGLPDENIDWVTVDIQDAGNQDYRHMAVINGLPAVAYKQLPGGGDTELMYAYADSLTPDDPSNWTHIVVDDENYNNGNDVFLIEAEGMAAIGYSSFAPTGARFARYARATAEPPTATDWDLMTVRVEDQVHHGEMLGMAWYDGRPFLCYLTQYVVDPTELGISYPNVVQPQDSAHWDNGFIDVSTGYSINEQTSALVLSDGSLAIIYRTTDGLKFTYYTVP